MFTGFMEVWYKHLQAASGADGPEAWLLVCTAVKAIYRWFKEVRVFGEDALDADDKHEATVDVLWATGLCQMRMAEMKAADFRNHHVVSTALNIHLFEHRVPYSVFDRVKAKADALESKVESLEKRLDSVIGTVATLKKAKKKD